MSPHFHVWTRWQIRRVFVKGAMPASYRAFQKNVASCPSCMKYFRRHQSLEAALCAVKDGVSPFAYARIECAVLETPKPQNAVLSNRRWIWAPAAGLTCAAALILALLWPRATPQRVLLPPNATMAAVTLTARGNPSKSQADIGIRLLRVLPEQQRVDGETTLSVGDVVTFTYTNINPSVHYLALLGIQQSGKVRWYYPGDENGRSIFIETNKIDEPLADGIRLSVRHQPGWLRVTAIFSEQPIDQSTLEDAVKVLAGKSGALEQLEPLPLKGNHFIEHSIRVDLGGIH